VSGAAEAVRLNGGNTDMTANEFASLWLDKFNNTKTTAPTAGRPQDANAVASRAGEAVQRAVTTPAGTSSAGGATAPVEVSTASGGEVAVSVADGGAPASGGTQGGALMEQAVVGQQGQTQEGEGGANAAAPVVSAELQAFIEDLAANPDRAFATDEEFLVAQERGELEPGDAVAEMDAEAIQKEIAEMDKRLALLEQKVDQIDKNVSSINANLSKILWIVGGGFIMAAIGWVIRGGLGN